jgi:hypothetical protein
MMKRKYVGFSKIYAITLKENIIQKKRLFKKKRKEKERIDHKDICKLIKRRSILIQKRKRKRKDNDEAYEK